MAAELPETREALDALALVHAGVLRGLSVEFIVSRERDDNGVRLIEAAELVGLGLVARPAYDASAVAARARGCRRRRVYL